ncbi:hypothetical protein, conserved [Trypanosoma brucei gambiense DAL972]|uniref:Uncharacterized protein n=1 Tax=Trypanosoma brucei gambiense (strain MHOM/CI/86/DAL972) TaxID=679716 RepID=C9ZUP6_TRYB9|nr:hypothetical protein, conserved [Trypanosoma brucei gambiense DAL972]CBH13134.1 hypothetical protein, conserved [Trypanosoma brucei gambiense DAL972]|eukprot:XP_011775411.1 hypothetical protein, conserved [Trypanosoma brucei gambiense DAL972]
MSPSSLTLRYVLPCHSCTSCDEATVADRVSLLDTPSVPVITWTTPSEFLTAVKATVPVDSAKHNGSLAVGEDGLGLHLLSADSAGAAAGDGEAGPRVIQLTLDWVLALPCVSDDAEGNSSVELHVLRTNRLDFLVQTWSAVTSHIVRLTTWPRMEVSFFPSGFPCEIVSGMINGSEPSYYEVRARIPIRLVLSPTPEGTKERKNDDRGSVSEMLEEFASTKRMYAHQLRALIHDAAFSCISSNPTSFCGFDEAPSSGRGTDTASPGESVKEEEAVSSASTNQQSGGGVSAGKEPKGPQQVLPRVFHSIPPPPVPVALNICLTHHGEDGEVPTEGDDQRERDVVLFVHTVVRAVRPRSGASPRLRPRRIALDALVNLFPERFAVHGVSDVAVAEVNVEDLSCMWVPFNDTTIEGDVLALSAEEYFSFHGRQDSEVSGQASPRGNGSKMQHNPYDRMRVSPADVDPHGRKTAPQPCFGWGRGMCFNGGGPGRPFTFNPALCGTFQCFPWTPSFALRKGRTASAGAAETSEVRGVVRSSWTGVSSWKNVTPGSSCSWRGESSGSRRGGKSGSLRSGASEAPWAPWAAETPDDVSVKVPPQAEETSAVSASPQDDNEVMDLSDSRQMILEWADSIGLSRRRIANLAQQLERLGEQFASISLQHCVTTDGADKRKKGRGGRNGQKAVDAGAPEEDSDAVHLVEGLIGASMRPHGSISEEVLRFAARLLGGAKQCEEDYGSVDECTKEAFDMIQKLDQDLRATALEVQRTQKDIRKTLSGILTPKGERKAKVETPNLFYPAIKALNPEQSHRTELFGIGAPSGLSRSGDILTLLRFKKGDYEVAKQSVMTVSDKLRKAEVWCAAQLEQMQLVVKLYKDILVPCLDARVATRRDEERKRSKLIVDWAVSIAIVLESQRSAESQESNGVERHEDEHLSHKGPRGAASTEKPLRLSNGKPLLNGGSNGRAHEGQAEPLKTHDATTRSEGKGLEASSERPAKVERPVKAERPAKTERPMKADRVAPPVTETTRDLRRSTSPKRKRKAPAVVAQPWSLMTVTPAPVVTTQRRGSRYRRFLWRLARFSQVDRLRRNAYLLALLASVAVAYLVVVFLYG